MKLHFDRSEFACKGETCCGHSSPVSMNLLLALEMLRFSCGEVPLHIISGFRCNVHNAEVSRAKLSQHCLGNACDISTPKGFTDEKFFDLACSMELDGIHLFGGVGLYEGRVHVDVRKADKQYKWSKK